MNAQTKVEASPLSAAMAAAFAEIEAATKDAKNPHFKSNYATLGAVVDAVKPALVKHSLFFTQETHDVQGGVCVETVIRHASGDAIRCGPLFVPANKNDAQGYGSALTYCRRYSLMTAFGVSAEDDDGNAAVASRHAPPAANGNGTKKADAPFAQGPAKNRTELKTMGRDFWREVEGCGDPDELDALLRSRADLTKQLVAELPDWWRGGKKGDEEYEGLGTVITRKQLELSNANPDWRQNPVLGG